MFIEINVPGCPEKEIINTEHITKMYKLDGENIEDKPYFDLWISLNDDCTILHFEENQKNRDDLYDKIADLLGAKKIV